MSAFAWRMTSAIRSIPRTPSCPKPWWTLYVMTTIDEDPGVDGADVIKEPSVAVINRITTIPLKALGIAPGAPSTRALWRRNRQATRIAPTAASRAVRTRNRGRRPSQSVRAGTNAYARVSTNANTYATNTMPATPNARPAARNVGGPWCRYRNRSARSATSTSSAIAMRMGRNADPKSAKSRTAPTANAFPRRNTATDGRIPRATIVAPSPTPVNTARVIAGRGTATNRARTDGYPKRVTWSGRIAPRPSPRSTIRTTPRRPSRSSARRGTLTDSPRLRIRENTAIADTRTTGTSAEGLPPRSRCAGRYSRYAATVSPLNRRIASDPGVTARASLSATTANPRGRTSLEGSKEPTKRYKSGARIRRTRAALGPTERVAIALA